MNRSDFHKFFKQIGPVVLPVIHVKNYFQVTENINKIVNDSPIALLRMMDYNGIV